MHHDKITVRAMNEDVGELYFPTDYVPYRLEINVSGIRFTYVLEPVYVSSPGVQSEEPK